MKPLNWVQWLTLLIATTVAITVPLIFVQLEHVQERQNDGLQTVICRVEAAQLKSPILSKIQKRKDVEFWASLLAQIHAAPCSIS